jgi:hypothetical protein
MVDQIEIRMAVDPIGFSWLLDRADVADGGRTINLQRDDRLKRVKAIGVATGSSALIPAAHSPTSSPSIKQAETCSGPKCHLYPAIHRSL